MKSHEVGDISPHSIEYDFVYALTSPAECKHGGYLCDMITDNAHKLVRLKYLVHEGSKTQQQPLARNCDKRSRRITLSREVDSGLSNEVPAGDTADLSRT